MLHLYLHKTLNSPQSGLSLNSNKLFSFFHWELARPFVNSTLNMTNTLLSSTLFYWTSYVANVDTFPLQQDALHLALHFETLGTKKRLRLLDHARRVRNFDYFSTQEALQRYFYLQLFKKNSTYRLVEHKTLSVLQLEQKDKSYLRHLEVNLVTNTITVLPIPYIFFYSFLLDQTALWKNVLMELAIYHKN